MKRIIIFSVLTSWLLTSCSPVMYAPTSQVTPLPEKKGDVEASGSFGLRGYEANANYAVTNHLAVVAQGRIASRKGDKGHELTGAPLKNNTVGLGITYYSTVNNNPALRWSVTGGVNKGNTLAIFAHSDGGYRVSSDNQQVYLQPTYGFVSRHFESIISCRFSKVNVNNVQSEWKEFNGKNYQFLSTEPAITFRGGPESIKAFSQTGYTFTNNSRQYGDITTFWGGRLNLTAGVQCRLGHRK